MSQINVDTIKKADGTGSLTVPAESGTVVTTASPSLGRRNLIINGAMVIDQRNGGSAVTGQQYTVDRWRTWFDPGTYSFQQVADAPTNFSNSLKITKTNTAQSTYGYLVHYIEGFNTAHLNFGTANAQTVTLSFWVKSSITGNWTAGIANNAENRAYAGVYSIASADTWEYKTITIEGDTTGTWGGSTNGRGVNVFFNFGATGSATADSWNALTSGAVASTGNTNLGTTNNATWQITGVQLEVGSVATPFEHRSYGEELALCQRYFYAEDNSLGNHMIALGSTANSTTFIGIMTTPVTMRSAPTLTTSGNYEFAGPTSGALTSISLVDATASNNMQIRGVGSGFTAGQGGYMRNDNDTSATFHFDAEL